MKRLLSGSKNRVDSICEPNEVISTNQDAVVISKVGMMNNNTRHGRNNEDLKGTFGQTADKKVKIECREVTNITNNEIGISKDDVGACDIDNNFIGEFSKNKDEPVKRDVTRLVLVPNCE